VSIPALLLYQPVVIYPIVKRQSEELALGYVTAAAKPTVAPA
jgi:hypothetical protein